LRVFENRVLRRIFGPKGFEVKGEWRKLHNVMLTRCYPGYQIEKKMGGACCMCGRGVRCIGGFGGET